MRTLPMPKNATLEMLSECCDILFDYKNAGCPRFQECVPFIDRLKEAGCSTLEAIEILSRTEANHANH